MSKQKFGSPPTVNRGVLPPDPDAIQKFVSGADPGRATEGASATQKPASSSSPGSNAIVWADLDDEQRGLVGVFNMRFTQREKMCLQYIDKKTPHSKHSFIISVLRPALAEKIKELTGEDISALLAVPDGD
ncbi:MAG: hypothetical protein ACREPQ_00360 [Rhodanobacter sp.]